jgi:multidrug efflux pump subunit AcrB
MWITRVSINNPVFAAMVMVAICVLGIFSYSRLGVEQMPDISLPGIWAAVEYPGATPEAIEREVLKPLEEAINSVAGVKRITSRAFEGPWRPLGRVQPRRRHGPRDAGRARPRRRGTGRLPA